MGIRKSGRLGSLTLVSILEGKTLKSEIEKCCSGKKTYTTFVHYSSAISSIRESESFYTGLLLDKQLTCVSNLMVHKFN